jgi:hypothetical protein
MYYLAITKCCLESLTLSCGFFNLHYNVGGENIKAGLGGVRRALIMLYDGCLITLERRQRRSVVAKSGDLTNLSFFYRIFHIFVISPLFYSSSKSSQSIKDPSIGISRTTFFA